MFVDYIGFDFLERYFRVICKVCSGSFSCAIGDLLCFAGKNLFSELGESSRI